MNSLSTGLLLMAALAVTVPAQCVPAATESFDGAGLATTFSCGTATPGTYPTGWTLDAGSTNAWRVDSGGTGSSATGPSGDRTSGSGNYLYTETSGACVGMVAILTSPCFDASTVAVPTVEFWYHMYGATMGTLALEYFDGVSFQPLWSLSGDQGDQWVQMSIGVPLYGGVAAQFRFVGTAGSSFTSDMALDDIKFGEPTPPQFQLNTPAASLDVNGVVAGGPFGPGAVSTVGIQNQAVMNVASSNVGSVFDIALTASPIAVPGAGGIVTPGGQVVNFDPLNPTVLWVNGGGSLPGLGSTFPGSFALYFGAPPVPVTVTAQMFVGDPAQIDGVAISQAAQLDVVADFQLGPANVACTNPGTPLTLTDDSFVQQPLGFSFNFYGVSYSDVYVGSNGHVTFGNGTTGWASSAAALNSSVNPMIAYLNEDLNPASGGSISLYADPVAQLFELCVTNLPAYSTGGSNTMKLTAINGGLITVDYDAAMTESEGTVGLSAGNNLGTLLPLNLSSAGGINGPIMIPAGSTPYEDFTTLANPLDLPGYQLNWILDPSGNPTMVL